MEQRSCIQKRPDVSAEDRASQERIKRVLKLRWTGMEVRAEEMQVALLDIDLGSTLLAVSLETD